MNFPILGFRKRRYYPVLVEGYGEVVLKTVISLKTVKNSELLTF